MKRKRLAHFFLALVVTLCLCSCMEEAKPEETVEKLETAFNNYDIEMMLECYEPSVQSMYAGMMEVGGALLGGIDLKTIVQGLGGFTNLYGDSLIEGGVPQIDIIINSMEEVSEEKVLADLTIKYVYSEEMLKNLPSNTQTEERMYAYLVYIDGTWYLSAEVPVIQ